MTIPDPGLNAVLREALQKPEGPLTEQDLLSLTNLNADGRGITGVEGLESDPNLVALRLDSNFLTDFPLAGALTNLTKLNLFNNHLTNFVVPSGLPNLSLLASDSTH